MAAKSWITGKERPEEPERKPEPKVYSREALLQKLVLRVDEVAFLLSDTERTIYTLVEEGELQAHCRKGIKSKPLKIVTTSVVEYFERHIINAEEWSK